MKKSKITRRSRGGDEEEEATMEEGTGKSARSRSRRKKSHQGSRKSSKKRLKSPASAGTRSGVSSGSHALQTQSSSIPPTQADLPADEPKPGAAKSTESKIALPAGEAAASKSNRPQTEQPEQPPPRREELSWNPTPAPADIVTPRVAA
ncbi:hypothetical protein MTO96_014137 [Rhipicephalus appendiculatus]